MATVAGSQRQLTHTSNTYESNGDVTIGGNLNINGTTTTIDTANLLVEDKNIVIGDVSSPSNTTADGGGITLKGASDKTINWINSTSSWTSNQTFSAPNLTLTNLSTYSGSDITALMISGGNIVGKRALGTAAFSATSDFATASHNHTLDSLSNTTITSNSSGEILKWNGSAWVNNTLAEAGIASTSHTHAINNLTDVTITSAAAGDYLRYSGTAWVDNAGVPFSDITSTPTTIAGYGITDAFDGAYSSLTGVPSTFTPSAHTLGSHSDVTVTSI